MKFLLSFLIALFLLGCNEDSLPKVTLGSMTDPRDGQTYKTVKIGSQTWMAENLNYKTDSSFCYLDDVSNCAKYGRLYKLSTALGKPESECSGVGGKACTLPPGDVQGVCPSGWHLPSRAEWDTLLAAAGGESVAGKFLKSSSGWEKDLVPIFQPFGPSPMEALKRRANSGDGEDTFLFSTMAAGKKDIRKKDIIGVSDIKRIFGLLRKDSAVLNVFPFIMNIPMLPLGAVIMALVVMQIPYVV